MATKKIRVYELARELGVENAAVIELADELKIGVKNHSSSIDEPSADRVRRLAQSKGMKKEAPAPEPEAAPADGGGSARKVVRAGGRPAPAPAPTPVAPAAAPPATPPADGGATTPDAPPAAPHRVVRSTGGIAEPRPVPRPPAPPTPPPARPAVPERPAARDEQAAAARPTAPPASRPDAPPAPPAPPGAGAPPAAGAPGPAAPPAGPGGKPIPPPPALRSQSGKPIPPPPGGGKPIPPPPGGRGPGAPRQRPSATFGAPRTGGPGRPGGGPPGRSGPGGGPPGRGGPGGGPGGPGGRGRPGGPPPRRKKKGRRRRTEEEFEPSAITYTPENAPVPEGEIVVPRGTTIQELAPRLNRRPADLVKLLFDAGEIVTGTQSLADEMIELIAETLGAEVLIVEPGAEHELELLALLGEGDDEEDEALLEPRPPVVTVMGHVDHGKTSLLDYVRHSNVVAGEAGGITQHIGAYQVHRGDREITFIDTPGHEAFTAMRSRGAQVTDIAILVVAADDGVMPQTIEAINHAKAAEVPIVVAVTKSDREDADPTRVRQQLTEQELVPEEWGGETIVTDVSVVSGQGIDDLLDSIVLVADAELAEEVRANPKAPARAFVLESHLDPGRGPVVTALVDRGTLRVGDTIVSGPAWGRVRAMFDENGEQVKEAGPSVPVEVLGLDEVPLAGDDLRVAPDDKTARTVAEARKHRRHLAELRHPMTLSGGARLEDVFAAVQRGEVATLNLIVKADVQGSLEAVTDALRKLDSERDEVRLSFVHRGVGGITESDVSLAAVSNATVIGFNVRPDRKARELAEAEKVELRLYEVIYQVLEDVQSALIGLLKPEFEEVVTGEAEVREVFSVPRVGRIAGCYVQHGTITRGSKVRFLREGTIIWKGQIASLKRFKEDVREVQAGYECGIGLENFQDLKPGDLIETFEEREVART